MENYDENFKERFWSKVEKGGADACWNWTAAKVQGYGRIRVNGVTLYAHRVAYECLHGPILAGCVVRHRCDNPSCVNPAHLEIGTHADNIRDRTERGRTTSGETHHNAKLNYAKAAQIRQRASMGEIQSLLAREFGVHHSCIQDILVGRTWREPATSAGGG